MDNNKRLSESSSTHNTTCRYPIKDGGIFDTQNQYHAVSLSGGKDSTAMLLLMIERGMPIDVVLTADTGMEFPEMYEHMQKQRKSSIENRARYGVPPYGNGWPGIRVRWCTGQLKTHLVNKEVNRLKADKAALHYVGVAADEAKRCKNDIYPLVMWGITEADALQICYDRGFDFGGLYKI